MYPIQNDPKKLKLWHEYPSETYQQELSKDYQHDRVQEVFKDVGIPVLWTKVASAMERFKSRENWSYDCLLVLGKCLSSSVLISRSILFVFRIRTQIPRIRVMLLGKAIERLMQYYSVNTWAIITSFSRLASRLRASKKRPQLVLQGQ